MLAEAVRSRRVTALAFVLAILIAPSMRVDAGDEPALARVTPDAEWNAVFDRTEGWTGADCAGSVDLGDGRTLWMFGDTWVGKRQPGAQMVNNSIAVHPTDKSAPWRPPDPRRVQFVWGPRDKNGKETAWAVPPPIPGDAASAHDWLWCNGGGVVGGTRDGQRPRLIVFFFRVRSDPHGKGVWAFTTVGTCFAVIDNVADPPERWRPNVYDMPRLSINIHDERGKRLRLVGDDKEFLWGMSASREKSVSDEASHVLVFGTLNKKGEWDTSLVLARTPSAKIGFEFFAGKDWRPEIESSAKPIAGGLVSEFSVEEVSTRNGPIWVLIQSEPFLGKHIFARTAPKPEGPWSERRMIYTVPDVAASRAYFTYAAKGHAPLSRPGELLVTYLVNSQNFADVVCDTTIYHPKFVRVPLAVILGK